MNTLTAVSEIGADNVSTPVSAVWDSVASLSQRWGGRNQRAGHHHCGQPGGQGRPQAAAHPQLPRHGCVHDCDGSWSCSPAAFSAHLIIRIPVHLTPPLLSPPVSPWFNSEPY